MAFYIYIFSFQILFMERHVVVVVTNSIQTLILMNERIQ